MSQITSQPDGSKTVTATIGELEALMAREVIARAPVPIKDGVLCPTNFEGIQRLARFMFASGMVPRGVDTEAQCMMLVAAGTEAGLGLGQIAKGCMVVNMRPSIWGDVALGLVRRSPLCESIAEDFDGEGDALTAGCTCIRKGEVVPIVRTFSIADAKQAGLWGKAGPWKEYPRRMLQMRARAFALRDAFPDILSGLSIAEEQLDIEEEPRPAPAPSLASVIDNLAKNQAPNTPGRGAAPAGASPPDDDTGRAAAGSGSTQASTFDLGGIIDLMDAPKAGTGFLAPGAPRFEGRDPLFAEAAD
jgi:hypothetical protein